jgi:hypothetical protein
MWPDDPAGVNSVRAAISTAEASVICCASVPGPKPKASKRTHTGQRGRFARLRRHRDRPVNAVKAALRSKKRS